MKHLCLLLLVLPSALAASTPAPSDMPGPAFSPPSRLPSPGGPVVYEFSREAGPDESLLLVGEKLTTNVFAWGLSGDSIGGREWKPKAQFLTNNCLALTMPEQAPDGPFILWIKNDAGWSEPVVLNQPQPWWCEPDRSTPDSSVTVYGRNLSRRPDFADAFVYLRQEGSTGVWARVERAGRYSVSFRVPGQLPPGEYEVWVHAGAGRELGWGGPVRLRVQPEPSGSKSLFSALGTSSSSAGKPLGPGATGEEIQRALDDVSARGGGTVRLAPGTYLFSGTMRIPAGTRLAGSGKETTILRLRQDPQAVFGRFSSSGWDQSPVGIHSPGDTMEYQVGFPSGGQWAVWLRYATAMQEYNQPGVSGNHTLSVDGGPPTSLMGLTNTGTWSAYRWAKAAVLNVSGGSHQLTWKNVKGGGISLDAFVFTTDTTFEPEPDDLPSNRPGMIVIQAEDCIRFVSREGRLPGTDRPAIWLCADDTGLSGLTLLGTPQVNCGIAIASRATGIWITNATVQDVRVADCDGKEGENTGLYAKFVEYARVESNEFTARAPLFICGARQSRFANNRLISATRFGGNAEAAILGRNEKIEECVIEHNTIGSPPGAGAGGPTARRMIWFSTGRGSITRNWIAGNGVEHLGAAGQPRFGGVAGTDQNVGETILFEGNHRTAFFGKPAGADQSSVTLPKSIPRTPENRLGSVDRRQLAYDRAGEETPFLPPDVATPGDEPPASEYYVSVFWGPGQGQTRRVIGRVGLRLLLERPWLVPPSAESLIAVGTGFYRNLIVGNTTPDGMTGIQLWISCMENVIADNTIIRQRKPGLFLYANATTLASSMPRTWNRGVSPLFWNTCEGNWVEECSAGVLVTSGDDNRMPVEFPRALGNVLRHNSFIRCRSDGVVLSSRATPVGVKDSSDSIVGTLVEFNVVRDSRTAYHAGPCVDAVLFRRNHAYFWSPVDQSPDPASAFSVDRDDTTVVFEANTIEGSRGEHDNRARDLQTPRGVRSLPR